MLMAQTRQCCESGLLLGAAKYITKLRQSETSEMTQAHSIALFKIEDVFIAPLASAAVLHCLLGIGSAALLSEGRLAHSRRAA